MENKELISVIIPVYNVEKYLRQCIDSVLVQTYENFEIILVDDGSTDSSLQICEEYRNRDYRVSVYTQENGGQSRARNLGFKYAKGEYVYFLDSDDWILRHTLETLLSIAKAQNADFVFFDGKSFLDEKPEAKIKQTYVRNHNYETASGYAILGALQDNREFSCSIPLLFIKKEYIESIGISFEEGIVYEDMLFAYEFFSKAETVAQCKESFYRRRYRENSTMTSKKSKRNFYSACEVYRKIKDVAIEIDKLNEPITKKYIVRCAFNALNYYNPLNWSEKKACKNDYRALKREIMQAGAHQNRALRFRCYGTIFWFIYKVYEKAMIVLKGN